MKNFENPNNAAFFFDDGDFLNLDEVAAVEWITEDYDDDDTGERVAAPELRIHLRASDVSIRRGARLVKNNDDRQRLLDALRVYHSKF